MNSPTRYDDVNALLHALRERILHVLGDRLVGLYVYGSVVLGDYDEGVSDVDVLAAVRDDLTDTEFAVLDAMHRNLTADLPTWYDRIEILYYSLYGLRTFRSTRSPIAVISPGEPFNRKFAGRDWLMNWYFVREYGVTVYGPPPQTIIAPISNAEFVQSVREHALHWRAWLNDATHRGFQAYAILTLCRAFYTVTNGEDVSKQAAARWTAAQLPQWAWLVQQALGWRLESRGDTGADAGATLGDTRAFVHEMIGRIAALPPT